MYNMDKNQCCRMARKQLNLIRMNKLEKPIIDILNRYNLSMDDMIEYLSLCAVKELEPLRPYDFLDVATAPGNVEKNWLIANI